MAYKDKDKQREAQREWVRRKRVEQNPEEFKARAEGTFTGSTKQGSTKRGKDIKCFADLPPDVQATINQMSRDDNGKIVEAVKSKRTVAAIKYQHLFPDRYHTTSAVCTSVVTGKPGDADYNGICTDEWRVERGR